MINVLRDARLFCNSLCVPIDLAECDSINPRRRSDFTLGNVVSRSGFGLYFVGFLAALLTGEQSLDRIQKAVVNVLETLAAGAYGRDVALGPHSRVGQVVENALLSF